MTLATPLSLVGEGDLSRGDSRITPLLVRGGAGISDERESLARGSCEGVAATGIAVDEGVEILVELIKEEGMTVRVLGFFHP